MTKEKATGSVCDFLKNHRPYGVTTLVSIVPDARVIKAFSAIDVADNYDDIINWVNQQAKIKNIYYSVNKPSASIKPKKPSKAEIESIEYLHCDIDPDPAIELDAARLEIMERIKLCVSSSVGIPQPTMVIDSGGGYHVLFRLSSPIDLPDPGPDRERIISEVESRNRAIALALGGDVSCVNIDRILRLPGTINYPDLKKREKGRVNSPVRVVSHNPDAKYSLDDFPSASRGPKASPRGHSEIIETDGKEINPINVSALRSYAQNNGKIITPSTLKLISEGPAEDDNFPSRSEAVFHITCDLIRSLISDNMIFGVLSCRDNKITDHIFEQNNPEEYISRQIKRAKESVNESNNVIASSFGHSEVLKSVSNKKVKNSIDMTFEDAFNKLNEKYYFIVNAGKKPLIFNWDSENNPVMTSVYDWEIINRNVNVFINDGNAKTKLVNVAKEWINSPDRNECEGLCFYPAGKPIIDSKLNLWRGFGIKPKAGDWTLMRNHIRRVLSRGIEEHYNYIIKWVAWALKNPENQAEAALVFQGGIGCGKGVFARAVCKMFGNHGIQTGDKRKLVGRFSSDLRHCCLLYFDEFFTKKDLGDSGILKSLITEPTIMTEEKFMGSVITRNCLHIILCSNEKHVIPAGKNERRFAVFKCGEKPKEKDYFDNLYKQMDKDGGIEAMMYDLINMDIGKWHPRYSIPQNEELFNQKSLSVRLEKPESIIFDFIYSGIFPFDNQQIINGNYFIPTKLITDYARTIYRNEFISSYMVNKVLEELSLEKYRNSKGVGFLFPDLRRTRILWDINFNQVKWIDLEDSEWNFEQPQEVNFTRRR